MDDRELALSLLHTVSEMEVEIAALHSVLSLVIDSRTGSFWDFAPQVERSRESLRGSTSEDVASLEQLIQASVPDSEALRVCVKAVID